MDDCLRVVSSIKTGAVCLDSTSIFRSISALEKELITLKHLYAKEVMYLRNETGHIKTELSSDSDRNTKLTLINNELREKINDQVKKNCDLDRSVSEIQQALETKNSEFKSLQCLNPDQTPIEINAITQKIEMALEENENIMKKFEEELLLKKDLENQIQNLEHSLEFEELAAQENIKNLMDKLAAARTVLLKLESQVRYMGRPEHSEYIANMLSNIKHLNEQQRFEYKRDAENHHTRTVAMLHSMAETDRKTLQTVKMENQRLLSCVEELNTIIRQHQAELIRLEHENASAEENLQIEKDRINRYENSMISKLNDQQEVLFLKMKELGALRNENLPLKLEAEALKALVKEEGSRMAAFAYSDTSYQAAEIDTQLLPIPLYQSSMGREAGLPQVTPSLIPGAPNGQQETPAKTCSNYSRSFRSKSANTKYSDQNGTEKVIGNGQDYFEKMFKTKTEENKVYNQSNYPDTKSTQHSPTTSSLGNIIIYDVSKDGSYITLHNKADTLDVEIGGYILKQSISGIPIASYVFPRMLFKAGSFITVYSGETSQEMHQPPAQLVFKEQQRWGTGVECVTMLCKPGGEAYAWTNFAYNSVKSLSSSSATTPGSSAIMTVHTIPCGTPVSTEAVKQYLPLKRLRECVIPNN